MARNKYPEETVKLIIDEALKLFMENGYDNTSIQNIIDNLNGLSKGAIYHHFKSKDEIFDAVCRKIGDDNVSYYNELLKDERLNGFEKLKAMFKSAYLNPGNYAIVSIVPKILSDPKFMTNQIFEIYNIVAPEYIQPIIEEGVRDGSIKADYPKELAETIITLTNIWLNPIFAKTTPEDTIVKMKFFRYMLSSMGLDVIDDEIIKEYSNLISHYM